jgi:EmrB/QacA subfamily drug resistance transporter
MKRRHWLQQALSKLNALFSAGKYLMGEHSETLTATGTPRLWRLLIGISIASFLGCIDFTIVNTTIPAIQRELTTSLSSVQWVMTLFVMALCAFMVSAGRLADLYGRRRVLYCGMLVFAGASLGTGLADSIEQLNVWRFVQGAACAVPYTATTAIVADAWPPQQRGRAIGILLAVNGLGLAIGPVAGGLLVSSLGWRWVFLLNVPLIALSFAFCLGTVQESRAQQGARLDIPGLLLLMIGVASLLLAISQGGQWGWLTAKTGLTMAVAITALALLLPVERRAPSPLVPLALLRHPALLRVCLLSALLAFFYCAAFFLMPVYLESTRHYDGVMLGLLLLPTTAVMALISPWVGRWVDKSGPRPALILGFAALAASAALQSRFNLGSPLPLLLGAFALMGLGWGCILGPLVLATLSTVSEAQSGGALGITWTLHNLGGAVGLAVAALIYPTYGYQAVMLLLLALSLFGGLLAAWRRR